MKTKVKEQVKVLLAQRGITLKKLAEKLTDKSNEKYTGNSLTQRLGRGTVTYNEMLLIAEVLDYKIKFEDINN